MITGTKVVVIRTEFSVGDVLFEDVVSDHENTATNRDRRSGRADSHDEPAEEGP